MSCWALWIVLGLLFSWLVYVAVATDLTVPDFVLRRTEAALAKSGLALQFGSARFDPTGKILLENVKVRTRQFDDPLLTCRYLYVRHDIWSMLSGWTVPEEIRIEGASLYLPAMISPSGTTEPIIRDLAVTLRHEGKLWQVEQFAGRLGQLTLTVHGELALATKATPSGARLSLDALTARYLQSARKVAPLINRLIAWDNPTLAVNLSVDPDSGNTADIQFTAGGVHQPWDQPLELGSVSASAHLPLGSHGPQPVLVNLATQRLSYRDDVRVENIRGVLKAEVTPDNLTGRALELLVTARSADYSGEHAIGPELRVDLPTWPVIRSTTMAQIDGEFLSAGAEIHLDEKSARLHAEGRVAAGIIKRQLALHTPRAALYFIFDDPVSFQADAVLSPGWHFERLTSRTEAGRIDSSGVKISAARGRVDIVGTSFLAHDARVKMGDNLARGSYWMDFATSDYRMLLDGRLRPADINGWFHGDWWLNFWNKYFSFPVAPVVAEVDVQGRWKDPTLSNNFVQARVRDATVWGGDFESVEATVFVRPSFTHGWALTGTRAGGTEKLTGTFKRFGVAETHETSRFEFDFTGNVDPTVSGRMLEGRADDVLATLLFSRPPQVHAWGAVINGVPDYQFTGEAQGGLHYYGFPLDTVRATGGVQGSDVKLSAVEFTLGGGHGSGRASLTGPPEARRLGFDAFLNEAKLGRTVRAVQEYDAYRTGRPFVPPPEAKFIRQAINSNLNVALSGQGDPANLASFKGTGNASLTGAKLGEIHLFGLLSQILSGLSLSFSSLKLDAIRSSIELDNGALFFPDLKVTGPSAVIDAKGYYIFETNALDFSARFKPYDQPGSLLAAAFSLVLNPLTSILELKLGGPLDDPKWSILLGSSAAPKGPAPAKPLMPAVVTPAPN